MCSWGSGQTKRCTSYKATKNTCTQIVTMRLSVSFMYTWCHMTCVVSTSRTPLTFNLLFIRPLFGTLVYCYLNRKYKLDHSISHLIKNNQCLLSHFLAKAWWCLFYFSGYTISNSDRWNCH